jgi:beta-barrel assembly-enhancing protease
LRSILFAFVLTSCFASGQVLNKKNTLPDIGVVGADTLSIDEELAIGQVIYSQLRGQGGVLYDPVVQEYIQALGNKLVIHADNTKYPFTFFVINNQALNAFAFYGGHVGTHTGLIYRAETESELASVLAHEIAHVTQRHIVRRSQAAERSSPLQIASLIGGAILMMASPQAGIAAISAGNAGAIQNQINYTRTFEKEADRIGLRILFEAGFDPFSAADFFGRLLESKRWSSQAPAFLQTHPLSLNRVAEARNRAENMPKVQNISSEMFHLVKARIQARYFYTAKHNISDFTQRLKAHHNINKNTPDSHLVYGLAIAFMRDNQFTQALSLLQQLHRGDNENLAYVDALSDVYIALNKFENAIDLLKPLAAKQPNNAIVTLNYANVLYKAGQHAQAIEVLKDYLMINPDSVLGHQLLSDAYAASQQPMQMHQANAEFYQLLSIHQKAIDELQFAYNYAENYLTKQRIRARINQLREKQLQMSQM